jgi:folate-binding protein YgfZ
MIGLVDQDMRQLDEDLSGVVALNPEHLSLYQLTVEPGTAPALVAWLDSMRFMLRVEVEDVTAGYAVLGEPLGAESRPGETLAWVDPWPGRDVVPAPARGREPYAAYGPIEGHPATGRTWRELIVPRDELPAAVGDRPLAGGWAADALRIAAWQPRLGFETDHRTIPHEVDWLRSAVHLHKGCYRGQETIARVHNLGRPPRRLAMLHLDGSGHALPALGAPVSVGGREVGRLTSVARHHEDGPIGLAILKRNTDEAADLVVDGVDATQIPIVRA